MFRPISPGHHQVTSKYFNVLAALCCLHATIHPPTTIYKWRQKLFPTLIILWYLQFYIFTVLHWLQILPYRITTTRSRCILSLWDSLYELQCLAFSSSVIYLWPDDGLVIEAETFCHLVTLNKINIHNTSCVLTCESLLLTCKHRTQRGWIT